MKFLPIAMDHAGNMPAASQKSVIMLASAASAMSGESHSMCVARMRVAMACALYEGVSMKHLAWCEFANVEPVAKVRVGAAERWMSRGVARSSAEADE